LQIVTTEHKLDRHAHDGAERIDDIEHRVLQLVEAHAGMRVVQQDSGITDQILGKYPPLPDSTAPPFSQGRVVESNDMPFHAAGQ
jgi:hypothetical protein